MTANYCDHCGEVIQGEDFYPYARLPFAVSSANVGESATVCALCNEELGGS